MRANVMNGHVTVHLDHLVSCAITLCKMLTQGLNEYWFRKEDLFTCAPICLADLI